MKGNKKRSGKEYTVATVADMINIVNEDNYQVFALDIAQLLLIASQMKESIKKETGKYPDYCIMPTFKWIDDGKQGLNKVTLNGEEFILKPKKKKKNEGRNN